ALAELAPSVTLAIGEHRHEGATEQFVVTGIAAQRGAVIRRRGGDVAPTASVPSGEIAARRGGPGKAVARLRLRPSRHHSRPSYGESGPCGHHRTQQELRRDHGSSTPSGGRTALARLALDSLRADVTRCLRPAPRHGWRARARRLEARRRAFR